MSFSKPAVKRKVGDEHRQFQEKWGVQCFFVEHRGTLACLNCTEKVVMLKIMKNTREWREPTGLPILKHVYWGNKISLRKQSKRVMQQLKLAMWLVRRLLKQESHSQNVNLSKSAYCSLHILSVQKKGQFSNISLSANTVAERITDLYDLYDQLCEKAKCFGVYSVSLDETTDITDTAQLAIYVCGVDGNFEVIEELLTVSPMHD